HCHRQPRRSHHQRARYHGKARLHSCLHSLGCHRLGSRRHFRRPQCRPRKRHAPPSRRQRTSSQRRRPSSHRHHGPRLPRQNRPHCVAIGVCVGEGLLAPLSLAKSLNTCEQRRPLPQMQQPHPHSHQRATQNQPRRIHSKSNH